MEPDSSKERSVPRPDESVWQNLGFSFPVNLADEPAVDEAKLRAYVGQHLHADGDREGAIGQESAALTDRERAEIAGNIVRYQTWRERFSALLEGQS